MLDVQYNRRLLSLEDLYDEELNTPRDLFFLRSMAVIAEKEEKAKTLDKIKKWRRERRLPAEESGTSDCSYLERISTVQVCLIDYQRHVSMSSKKFSKKFEVFGAVVDSSDPFAVGFRI